jgi:hypothetical protein
MSDAFPSSYLKAEDLNGKAVKVTIESVSMEKMGDDTKPAVHFVGKDKTLVLNKTNAWRIVDATGSDDTDDWGGWTITLYPCKVEYQGKSVPAIRVDDRPGSSKGPAGRALTQRDEAPADVTEDDIPF